MANETIVSRVSSIFRGASGSAGTMFTPGAGTSVEQSYADEMTVPQEPRREQITEIARANLAEDIGAQVELLYRKMIAKRLWKKALWLSPLAVYGLWRIVRRRRAAS